jgi:hypothetical protein
MRRRGFVARQHDGADALRLQIVHRGCRIRPQRILGSSNQHVMCNVDHD